MFGLKIAIFKKSKGVHVDPQPNVKKVKVDPDYEQFQKEKRQKQIDERKKIIGEAKDKFYNDTIKSLVESFIKKWPAPFEVGEEVIINYYGGYNEFALGWYGSPQSLYKTFEIEELDGPWKAPVGKVFVNSASLWDKICERADIPNAYDLNVEFTEQDVKRALYDIYYKLTNHDTWNLEWCVDFDWEKLKVPYDDSSKGDKAKGWLDLRWGGFNAHYFISASRELAEKQIALFAKEKEYKKIKSEMDAELKVLQDEIEAGKKGL